MPKKIEDAEYILLYDTLQIIDTALNDWIVTYAEEFCDEKSVKESKRRITARGTLSYIGSVIEKVHEARKVLVTLENIKNTNE